MKPSALLELLQRTIPGKLPVLIKGAPGVGKSDIVAQAAQAAGADLILSHPVVSDPTDYKGLPGIVDKNAEFLPFGELRQALEADRLTAFFLDDLGQAPPAVQAAAMQLILARRVNGHRVSPHVCFIAATNRRQDRAGVSGILEPVKSRFACIVELEVDLADWCKWAIANGMPVELIAFIRFRPELLHKFSPTADITNGPCPRTVAYVGKLMALQLPGDVLFEAVSGAAGEGFASEFLAFRQVFREMPNPDAILLNPDAADVPEDPAVLYALSGALAHRANANNADRLFKYVNRLPGDFQVWIARDVHQRCPDATATRGFIEWATANQDVLL